MAKEGVGADATANPVMRLRVTSRQAQMLGMAAQDIPDEQIAARLQISLPTVRTQWQRFFRANGVHSRAGAVALWLKSR
jgi:DNA-binding CsgD family transcriptional regulator